ncbi:hypothetical protein Tco_0582400, partial [Tanacetum coccineum]
MQMTMSLSESSDSFRRTVRDGVESSQLEALRGLIEGIELSSANDRW